MLGSLNCYLRFLNVDPDQQIDFKFIACFLCQMQFSESAIEWIQKLGGTEVVPASFFPPITFLAPFFCFCSPQVLKAISFLSHLNLVTSSFCTNILLLSEESTSHRLAKERGHPWWPVTQLNWANPSGTPRFFILETPVLLAYSQVATRSSKHGIACHAHTAHVSPTMASLGTRGSETFCAPFV